ncbi:MAG: putative regulatory protein FmdB family [Phycisphaerales bacterium]|nr:putative regulatory protein FmdB family [Phycisphaerales bacterium]
MNGVFFGEQGRFEGRFQEFSVPIYEYTCQSCNAKFEQLVRTMSGESKPRCPECDSVKTARALSVFAVGAEGAKSASGSSDAPMCGRCGGAPGSCGME